MSMPRKADFGEWLKKTDLCILEMRLHLDMTASSSCNSGISVWISPISFLLSVMLGWNLLTKDPVLKFWGVDQIENGGTDLLRVLSEIVMFFNWFILRWIICCALGIQYGVIWVVAVIRLGLVYPCTIYFGSLINFAVCRISKRCDNQGQGLFHFYSLFFIFQEFRPAQLFGSAGCLIIVKLYSFIG